MKKYQIINQCNQLGIDLNLNESVKTMQYKIAMLNCPVDNWALKHRINNPPQLCYAFNKLTLQEQQYIMQSLTWIAEEKIDGERMMVYYHPTKGFSFYSRNISVVNFLPVNYTDKIFIPSLNLISYPHSFILDTEITSVSKKGVHSVVSILNSIDSYKKQQSGDRLVFNVFDILYYNDKSLLLKPLCERNTYKINVCNILGEPFKMVPSIKEDKEDFYSTIINNGGEGIVLKNTMAGYYPDQRIRNVQVKLKPSMLGENSIYAFISGYIEGKDTLEGLIGSIKVSIFIQGKPTWIATIGGISAQMRADMTTIVEGKVTLTPSYYNKVIKVTGAYITNLNKRLMHCRCVDWNVHNISIEECTGENIKK